MPLTIREPYGSTMRFLYIYQVLWRYYVVGLVLQLFSVYLTHICACTMLLTDALWEIHLAKSFKAVW